MSTGKIQLAMASSTQLIACLAFSASLALSSVAQAQYSISTTKQEKQDSETEKKPPAKKTGPRRIQIGDVHILGVEPPIDQSTDEQLAAEAGPNPKVDFSEPKHDFGEVWVGTKLEHAFLFKNIGEKPLNILTVKPSCGCTLAGKYDKIIAPGATGSIPISVNSEKLSGKFTKTIRVTTDDPSKKKVKLTITGLVKHYVKVEPKRVSFLNLKPSEARTKTLTLTNNGTEPLQLTLPEPSVAAPYSVKLEEKEAGQKYELVVQAKPPYKVGRNTSTIILTTNNPKQPELKIKIAGTALARLVVSPKQLIIAKPSPNETTKKVTITNNGDSPVHLLDASVDDEKLTLATTEVTPGMKYEVIVTIPAGYKPDNAGKTLKLKFDDSQNPLVQVPIKNTSRKPRPAQLLEGKPAPKAEFTTHGGYVINTNDIKDEALVLKFYATWCGFCKKSLPNIEKVYQEYKDKGVRFIAVNLDNPNDPRKSRQFTPEQGLAKLKDLGVTFDVAFDPQKKIGRPFKVTSFPTMFILDKSGKVANVTMGAIQGKKIDVFKKQLDDILASQNTKISKDEPVTPTVSFTGTK